MIDDPQLMINLISTAIAEYQKAIEARKYLNHQSVYTHCKRALENIALTSFYLVHDERVSITEANAWVKELPIPNGLFSKLIEANDELMEKYFPLLDFTLSYPTSSRNIYLVQDSLLELLDNLEQKDDRKIFVDNLKQWRTEIS
ncbi:MAG: hypothetical protein ACTSXO_12910 [Candidatus Heimdallarchaeota archaeon]